MQLVAKSRLTEFKQEFSSMNAFGLLNYLAGQAATAITEMNPLIVRNTDETHLLDPEFHLNAFRYRERDILVSAARRLKRHIDSGMDSFDAFNVCQHHLVQVALPIQNALYWNNFIWPPIWLKMTAAKQCYDSYTGYLHSTCWISTRAGTLNRDIWKV